MSKSKKQSHVVWKCDYHIVWTPKYRFRVMTGLVKDLVDHDSGMLSEWKGCEVIELNVQVDHVHLVVSIPPKVAVSELMGTLKGKIAIKLFNRTADAELSSVEEKALLGQPLLVTGPGGRCRTSSTPLVSMRTTFGGTFATRKRRIAKRKVTTRVLICLSCLMSSLRATPASF